MNKIKIYHVFQEISEYYQYKKELGEYVNISKDVAEDWKPSSFDYVELRHNNQKKNNLYGMFSIS